MIMIVGVVVVKSVDFGILQRCINFLLENKQEDQRISLMVLEVYNKKLIDLLEPDNTNQKTTEKPLKIITDNKETLVKNAKVREIKTIGEALEAIKKTTLNRKTSSTAFNSVSSRSHCIYRIFIQGKETKGMINIVDLAGSEKYSVDQMKKRNVDKAMISRIQKEAVHINLSLGTLRKVFQLLRQNRFSKGKLLWN